MVAPITSIKHYTYRTNLAVASAASINQTVVQAVVAPAQSADSAVVEGAIIKAVFIEVWLKSNASAGTDTQFDFYIYKNPGGKNDMIIADALNAGAWDNKKNILFSSQGVLGDLTTQAIPVHRGWIKIPKGKQRFGLADKLNWFLTFTGDAGQVCGLATYKEYN